MTGDDFNKETGVAFRDSLKEHFGELEDYRRSGSVNHLLIDILFITICAVIGLIHLCRKNSRSFLGTKSR